MAVCAWHTKALPTTREGTHARKLARTNAHTHAHTHTRARVHAYTRAHTHARRKILAPNPQTTAPHSYGTGAFLLMNAGNTPVPSTHGLLTTALYKMGREAPTVYALEGAVACCAVGINWFRDSLGMLNSAPEVSTLAEEAATFVAGHQATLSPALAAGHQITLPPTSPGRQPHSLLTTKPPYRPHSLLTTKAP